MNAHESCTRNGIEQGGNIPMTYQPLGVLLVAFQRDSCHQVNGAVAAPCADDGLDTFILQRPSQVGGTFVSRSCINAYGLAVDLLSDNRLQPPAPDKICCLTDSLLCHPIGRGYYSHFIPCLQKRWLNYLLTLLIHFSICVVTDCKISNYFLKKLIKCTLGG